MDIYAVFVRNGYQKRIIVRGVKMTEQANTKCKFEVVCPYCLKDYVWIKHKHTKGFYEHALKTNFECIMNSGHKIFVWLIE